MSHGKPAVSGMGEVYLKPGWQEAGLERAVTRAVGRGETRCVYMDTEYRFGIRQNGVFDLHAFLPDTKTPLPDLFDSTNRVQAVIVRAINPGSVTATPGWYRGRDFGYPEGYCVVDPFGRLDIGGHRPTVYAQGERLAPTIWLYQTVVTGTLQPTRPYR